MKEIPNYYENNGSFKTRQHVINHIDMILGLGKPESYVESNDRLIAVVDHEAEDFDLMLKSKTPDEEIQKIRTKALFDSIFATDWQQIIPAYNDEDCVEPKDINGRDDLLDVLDFAIDQWIETDGSVSAFFQKTIVIVVLLSWNPVTVDRIVVKRIPSESEIQSMPVALNNRRMLAVTCSQDEGWIAFSEQVCKNSFMKEHLRMGQKTICPVCKKHLNKTFVIHHVDYDHKCSFYEAGMASTSVPDCERCYSVHRNWFDECSSKLRAVHNGCNYIIDQIGK